jgi:hypothetical protein
MLNEAEIWSITAFTLTWSVVATAMAVRYWRERNVILPIACHHLQTLEELKLLLEQFALQRAENAELRSQLDIAKGIIDKVQRRYAHKAGRHASTQVSLRQERSERKVWLALCEELAMELAKEKSARAKAQALQDILRRLIDLLAK